MIDRTILAKYDFTQGTKEQGWATEVWIRPGFEYEPTIWVFFDSVEISIPDFEFFAMEIADESALRRLMIQAQNAYDSETAQGAADVNMECYDFGFAERILYRYGG
jgi:hypothetical protein